MTVEGTILAFFEKVRSTPSLGPDIDQLQGEVFQIMISGGNEYNFAFRNGTVERDSSAPATIKIEGESTAILAIIEGRLDPLTAVYTRRVKTNMRLSHGPMLRRILLGAAISSQSEGTG